MRHISLLITLFLLVSSRASAEPYLPEDLKPWKNWVLEGENLCPPVTGTGERQCQFLTELKLSFGERGAEFEFRVNLSRPAVLPLPGGGQRPESRMWPEDLRVNNQQLAILSRNGLPSVSLDPGEQILTGRFRFSEMPKSILVPKEVGLVRVNLRGKELISPRISNQGELWLEESVKSEESDSLSLGLIRELRDGSPQILTTHLHLKVSGKARELILPEIVPSGAVLYAVKSGLNFQYLSPNGLKLQLRPGVHDIILETAFPAEILELPPATVDSELQYLYFVPDSALRDLELQGGSPLDRSQLPFATTLGNRPDAQLRVIEDEKISLITRRRGEELLGANAISLNRRVQLDLKGEGASLVDEFSGQMSQGFRLNMLSPSQLSAVYRAGEPQLISLDPRNQLRGVEIRDRSLYLKTEGRIEKFSGSLLAVGWDTAVDNLRLTLALPPGYTLFSVSGVDNPPFNAWLHGWSLYEVFFVFLISGVLYRLCGVRIGLVALISLVLNHQRPDSPGAVLVLLIILMALLRVLPGRWFITTLNNLILLVAAIQTLGFIYSELREGIYPQLESGYFGERDNYGYSARPQALRSEEAEGIMAASDSVSAEINQLRAKPAAAPRRKSAYDPNAVIQTGEGVASWQGREYTLSWNGPVNQGERISVNLITPPVNMFLSLLRIGFLLALLSVFIPRLSLNKVLTAGVTLLALVFPHSSQADDFPSEKLLGELKTRLLKDECSADCAEIESLMLEESGTQLRLSFKIGSKGQGVVTLPGNDLPLARVVLEGGSVPPLRRDSSGYLQARVPDGVSRLIVDSAPLQRNSLTLQFPRFYGRVESRLQGWVVDGLLANGLVSGSLKLSRRGGSENTSQIQEESLPEHIIVRRSISLGFPWEMTTTVRRLGSQDRTTTTQLPLISGERLNSDRYVREENSQAVVTIPRGSEQIVYFSSLTEQPELALKATTNEEWEISCSNAFQCSIISGIKPGSTADSSGPRLLFQPWPGEEARLSVVRLNGAPGRSANIQRARVEYRLGVRQLDGTLSFTVRSSQGGNQQVSLPEAATIKSVSVGGEEKPLRGKDLLIPVSVGEQEVRISWQQPHEPSFKAELPKINLGMPGVNLTTVVTPPASSWVLHVAGQGVGPVVFFFPKLLFVTLLSVILGWRRYLHLSPVKWFLLGVGLIPLDAEALIVPMLWFGLLATAERTELVSRFLYNTRQVAIVVATFIFMGVLYSAVQGGLLKVPDMRVENPSGLPFGFSWYLDRFGEELTGPTLFSVSIPWVYRPLMFIWSGWLVLQLIQWISWGWGAFSRGGTWRGKEKKERAV
jgi:hypothetical protein